MKPYLFTATDASGKRETTAREAASIEHLRSVLEREGWRDIQFLDDETLAEMRQQRAPLAQPRTAQQFRFEAALRKGRSRKLILLQAMRNNWMYLLAALLFALYGVVRGRPVMAAGGAIGFAFIVWFLFARLRDGDDYDALVRAQAHGDWAAAAGLIRRLEKSAAARNNEQLAIDLQFRKARLLVRDGRLDDALALVEPLRGHSRCINGMFESRCASLYYAAERIADFVRLMQRAYEASGRAQLQALDFAFVNARFGDCARTRELLDTMRRDNLNPMHARIYDISEALCALRAGDMGTAESKAAAAMQNALEYLDSAPQLPMNSIVAGYAAIVFARAGRPDLARQALAPWRDVAKISLDPGARRQLATLILD